MLVPVEKFEFPSFAFVVRCTVQLCCTGILEAHDGYDPSSSV